MIVIGILPVENVVFTQQVNMNDKIATLFLRILLEETLAERKRMAIIYLKELEKFLKDLQTN
jgi:hypothetical protein